MYPAQCFVDSNFLRKFSCGSPQKRSKVLRKNSSQRNIVQDTYINSVFYADFKYVICFAKKSRNLEEIGQISAEKVHFRII
jgi:hypothetical protein